ncbi:DUF1737 domain-containing protein [Patescibacteria group bacterium]|nr:DUF1737 domain-containing protein [Patescibacteria group bacterium]MBU2220099.1 DUF1737 domain-containing protein [Patescibacteria group bacterium]MBU2264871.1 DUF1737 domain-containing protein [Patescibacteria group bacterium]
MKYVVVSASTLIGMGLVFEQAVNEKIEAGYKPIGGIAVVHTSEEARVTFYQAMIKDDKK